jgi:hypothetical protein
MCRLRRNFGGVNSGLATDGICRKSSIVRFVRQTRTMTYEKSARAKVFFTRFSIENRAARRNSARKRASNAHARRAL